MPRTPLVLLLVLSGLLAACQKHDSAAEKQQDSNASASSRGQSDRGNRIQVVTTTRSRVETVPLMIEAQGNVLALDEVDIRPQKNGMITGIHFREGQELKAGQLLFTLDARDDAANVGKAEAAVASADAGVAIARRDLARSQELFEKQYIAPSALDTSRNRLDTALANLGQAKAALEQARVSQSYTRITAPFDGRAGVINVRPGSLVTSNSTATSMVKLTRMNPIGVSFSISERDMPPLLEALRKGSVRLSARTNAQATLKGEVIFVDSNVDKASGTLLVKGRLDNRERLVWPGQFVNVSVEAGELRDVVVLPAQAVVNGPNNRFVYSVGDDQTVEPKPVEVLRIANQKAVVSGIPGGLKIVQEGTQNLRPGAKIQESGNGKREDGGRRKDGGPRGEASAPAAADKAGAAGGVEIPAGFQPRDPERWANANDDQKREIIARWRERQAAKASGAQ
ncbi:efflux RND transporter periplasmic adaptor subunit [Uliginosibacterium paludis]|uniref:Efflux RND transporter periplasmic adaptor subunit n=1 Tax=Uliginosibacterium paludis TaxID=1615952 RepID=A0ABV2CMZ2_9RHOO